MRLRAPIGLLAALLLSTSAAIAQTPTLASSEGFRRANESAAGSAWTDAIAEYRRLESAGVRAPSLYWNWAQAASAAGRKGEAIWALLRAQELAPGDAGVARELERLRGELGLDPSEVSLGLVGDARRLARRFRFDVLAVLLFLVSIGVLFGTTPRAAWSLGAFLAGLLVVAPLLGGAWRGPRGVVVQKDAPLLDIPRDDAVALANLREGEVVPLLADEGEYLRIQDASGARGFALKTDVRHLGME
jgi:hypothetical protein